MFSGKKVAVHILAVLDKYKKHDLTFVSVKTYFYLSDYIYLSL